MKKPLLIIRLFAVFLIVITACCIHSCKKDQNNKNGIITTDNAAIELREWLLAQKDDSVAAQKIIVSAQWDKARSIGADSSVYELVPLFTTANPVTFEQGKSLQRYLVLQRQQGVAIEGYIYETFGNSADIAKNENELITTFAHKKLSYAFTGNLTKFTLKGAFDETTVYQNGVLLQYRKLYKAGTNGGKVIQTTDKKIAGLSCTDWYWVTEYTDGRVTSEYIGRTCYCNDQQQSTAIRDTKGTMNIRLNCDGGGGGGGGSSDPGGNGDCPPQTTQSVRNGKVFLSIKSSCVVAQPTLEDLFEIDYEFQNYYNEKMTDAEKSLAIAHPIDAYFVFLNSKDALQQASTLFPGSQLNTIADAFRHAFWNALNTKSVGSDRAKEFADAHENFPNNPDIQKQMDLYNNNVGRIIMNELQFNFPINVNYNQIQNAIEQQALDGSLKIIENGQLVPSHL